MFVYLGCMPKEFKLPLNTYSTVSIVMQCKKISQNLNYGEFLAIIQCSYQEFPFEEDRAVTKKGNGDKNQCIEEILYALRDLGRGKAVGPGGIPNEKMMFGLSWRSTGPLEWHRSVIIPVFKDGTRNWAIIPGNCSEQHIWEGV